MRAGSCHRIWVGRSWGFIERLTWSNEDRLIISPIHLFNSSSLEFRDVHLHALIYPLQRTVGLLCEAVRKILCPYSLSFPLQPHLCSLPASNPLNLAKIFETHAWCNTARAFGKFLYFPRAKVIVLFSFIQEDLTHTCNCACCTVHCKAWSCVSCMPSPKVWHSGGSWTESRTLGRAIILSVLKHPLSLACLAEVAQSQTSSYPMLSIK